MGADRKPKIRKQHLYVAKDSTFGRIWVDEEDMQERFEEYLQSDKCLNHTKKRTIIDQDTLSAVQVDVPAPRSPTIKGFCVFCGTSSSAWYQNYADNPDFAQTVRKITDICEQETRGLFEDGCIPANLAALWMGGYGYSTKQEQDINGGVPVVISGEDKLDG